MQQTPVAEFTATAGAKLFIPLEETKPVKDEAKRRIRNIGYKATLVLFLAIDLLCSKFLGKRPSLNFL